MDGLVGDIGGTHARFALADPAAAMPQAHEPRIYDNTDYPTAEDAIEAYLKELGLPRRPRAAVLAVAGPISGGAADFTNSDWELSEERLRREGGFAAARLINDFAAQALGARFIRPEGLRRLGPEVQGMADMPIAIFGPGTGFGLGILARDGRQEVAVATEGGHVGFAPTDETEVEIWRFLAARHGRVSVERVLSGHGLYELYLALAAVEGVQPGLPDERQVTAASGAGDALAARAVDRFCRILGSVAGDIALSHGARGGVYVTGGVAQKLGDALAKGGFRERFEDKGRFRDYMRAIPSFLVLEPYTALIGAASLLGSLGPA